MFRRAAFFALAWLALCGFPLWHGGAAGPVVGAQVSTIPITETSGSASLPSGSYVNFALGFADAAVPSGSKVDIRDSSGTSVPVQQYDGAATYASGSLRFASFKIKTPSSISSGATANYQVWSVSGSPNNSSSLTTSPITAHDFKVLYTVSGTTYTASLNTCLGGSNFRVISQGPVGKEWRCNQAFMNGGTPHSALWCRFYVRLYEDNSTIRVVAVCINSYVQNGGDITVSAATWQDGASVIVNAGAITAYRNGAVFFGDAAQDGDAYWTANKPAFMAMPLQADMQTNHLIFEMGDGNAGLTTAIGTATPDTYSANYNGVIDGGGQDGTGFHPWLGQLMMEPASALISRQPTWHRMALVRDMSSYAAATHWYESANFNLAVLSGGTYSGMGPDRSTTSWGSAPTLTLTGGAPLYAYDATHYPSWGKYTYLVTGDAWALDEMQAQYVSIVGFINPAFRNQTLNGHAYIGTPDYYDQAARGTAWAAREIDDAEWVTPDNDPAKQYFKDLLTTFYAGNTDYQAQQYSDTPARATLGAVTYTLDTETLGQAGWMHDFIGLSYAEGLVRGRLSTSDAYVTSHIQKWILGRGLAGTGCPFYAYVYRTSTVQGNTVGTIATAWNQVNADDGSNTYTQPMFPSGTCPSSGMWTQFKYSDGPEAYPANGQATAEALAQAGVTSASTIRDYIINNRNANVSYGPGAGSWASAPQFMIRPRGF